MPGDGRAGWTGRELSSVGYEINLNRYFYVYQPPRPLDEINADLEAVEAAIASAAGEVTT